MIEYSCWLYSSSKTFFACTFCFPNTDHVLLLRRIVSLFCSLKRAHASVNMPACILFNPNKRKNRTSWVLAQGLFWESKMYNRKRSIPQRFHSEQYVARLIGIYTELCLRIKFSWSTFAGRSEVQCLTCINFRWSLWWRDELCW